MFVFRAALIPALISGVWCAVTLPAHSQSLWETPRHVVICALDSTADTDLYITTQMDLTDPAGFDDRDLHLVSIRPERVETFRPRQIGLIRSATRPDISDVQSYSDRYQCDPDTNSVSLIGRDGFEKARWLMPVSSETLFQLIDSMPMRQRELRTRTY